MSGARVKICTHQNTSFPNQWLFQKTVRIVFYERSGDTAHAQRNSNLYIYKA